MARLVMGVLDAALGHPRGLLGRLGAALMVRGNAEQEAWAVEQAQLRPGETYWSLGTDPGWGWGRPQRRLPQGGGSSGWTLRH